MLCETILLEFFDLLLESGDHVVLGLGYCCAAFVEFVYLTRLRFDLLLFNEKDSLEVGDLATHSPEHAIVALLCTILILCCSNTGCHTLSCAKILFEVNDLDTKVFNFLLSRAGELSIVVLRISVLSVRMGLGYGRLLVTSLGFQFVVMPVGCNVRSRALLYRINPRSPLLLSFRV
ncbi:hypothetical protein AUEXF2481DRAFT_273649 [Aureobasidium subglaciale EXF-2481]|uniref:Uncharacterized protein n=1 Tax=Aureobasidium subglaciale (strain EXF-2481) TaxID=1043005 RepID=A0A074Y9H4_AURSE|nr:uncharacterized protein AUEXF2481DRAFT_273649 [Aureobasidium subglaciale EXF-2481]KEQ94420.1 hypothetical protein AUEXF2481DRAFT_273649 [Aureobasidium subglaciale EXF-2481]